MKKLPRWIHRSWYKSHEPPDFDYEAGWEICNRKGHKQWCWKRRLNKDERALHQTNSTS